VEPVTWEWITCIDKDDKLDNSTMQEKCMVCHLPELMKGSIYGLSIDEACNGRDR
jgi:hypothetical protein